MKKVIVVPDSFKGTLTSLEAAEEMKRGILQVFPDCEIHTIPVADGGEGTVDCFLAALGDGETVSVRTTNAFGEAITARYARFDSLPALFDSAPAGPAAVIEMASAAGLVQAEGRLDPCHTTTYGVGTMIRHAVEHGCTSIILGLGGSCTNDAGMGAAMALGAVFYDKAGRPFVPDAVSMDKIGRIDCSAVRALLKGCTVTAMCDITNPMYGPRGAAHIFGPQKGADASAVILLDHNLAALSDVIRDSLGLEVAEIPGAGSAGAFGAGVVAFLGGTLKSGIDTLLDLSGFDRLLPGTDMVFTGEGRADSQSLDGKAVSGIGRRAKAYHVPVTVIAGSVPRDLGDLSEYGITAVFSINHMPVPFEEAILHTKENLRRIMENLARFSGS